MGIMVNTEFRTIISKHDSTLLKSIGIKEKNGITNDTQQIIGKYTGRIYPAHVDFKDSPALIDGRVSDLGELSPLQCVTRLNSGLKCGAEVIYHARFLIYAILQAKQGRKSLTPWIISICIEITTICIQMTNNELNCLEYQEYSCRVGKLIRYIFRQPIFDKSCGTLIDSLIATLHKTRLLSPIAGNLCC